MAKCGKCGGVWRSVASVMVCGKCGGVRQVWRGVASVVGCGKWRGVGSVGKCGGVGGGVVRDASSRHKKMAKCDKGCEASLTDVVFLRRH